MDISYPMYYYDPDKDILEVFLDSRHNCLENKEFDDIIVYRQKHDNKIIGFTIHNYSINKNTLRKMYPTYVWNNY